MRNQLCIWLISSNVLAQTWIRKWLSGENGTTQSWDVRLWIPYGVTQSSRSYWRSKTKPGWKCHYSDETGAARVCDR